MKNLYKIVQGRVLHLYKIVQGVSYKLLIISRIIEFYFFCKNNEKNNALKREAFFS